MRVLLDENFPPRVQRDFVGHESAHVIAIGWRGILNGELLTKAEQAGFDVLVTLDTNIPPQNEIAGRKISVYVLQPDGQGTQATRALIGEVLIALQHCEPGQVRVFTNRTGKRRK
jgi:predicted nuclease of predicted toxin-antitoxin system